ncbi:hypothetical protein AOP6_0126 [Desulfuromonas sp. AOP6]|nr:hypothetical protein AOP6_0126 [Desulfuromonas sp. AOP6]
MKSQFVLPIEIRHIFKVGLFIVITMIGLAVTAFILWALFCMGSACVQVLSTGNY